MKKIIFFILMFVGVFCLSACEINSPILGGSGNYPNELTKSLNEGTDYVDHAETYDFSDNSLTYDEETWYENNLKDVPLPDPHVFYYEEDETYCIVGTSDRLKEGNCIDMYTTKDFVTFERKLGVYNSFLYDGWENDTKPSLYAPEIYEFGGRYYMYYSAYDESTNVFPGGVRRNSVVVSNSPYGPYQPIVQGGVDGLNNYLFNDPNNERFNSLDVTVFVDDDNKMYMYYSVEDKIKGYQKICGVQLNNPYSANWSTYQVLVIPGAIYGSQAVAYPLDWERFRSPYIVEAPYVIKSDNGKYYMTYSVNGCWNKYYNVCYAASDSPLGTYMKPYKRGESWTNLLLGFPGNSSGVVFDQWTGFASGTGHHCFFNIGDEIMIGYHAHQNRDHNYDTQKYEERYFAFDYLYFDEEGVPFCNGPTWSPQPLPEALSGSFNVAEGATVKSENVTNASAVIDNYIVDCYNLTSENNKEVVLGAGTSFIEIDFGQEYIITGVAIYNSSFYDKAVMEIEYIDFGNGNAICYSEFSEKFIDDDKEFIFPGSAFTFELLKEVKASKVVICFKLPDGGQINEVKILGY